MSKHLHRSRKFRTVYIMVRGFRKEHCGGDSGTRNGKNNRHGVRKGDEIIILENRWVRHKKTGMEFQCHHLNYKKTVVKNG